MRRFEVVRTERLVMRRWREEDRGPFAAMNADAEVMRYFPAPFDRVASDARVDRIEERFRSRGSGCGPSRSPRQDPPAPNSLRQFYATRRHGIA